MVKHVTQGLDIMLKSHIRKKQENEAENENKKQRGPEMWIQEAIFGHRFVEEQNPALLLLEVLSICKYFFKKEGSFLGQDLNKHDNNKHEEIKIGIIKSKLLRYILFEDQYIKKIIKDQSKDQNESDHKKWINSLKKECPKGIENKDIDFLEKISLKNTIQAVQLLRSIEIDPLNNRRWSSKFLAPRGINLIYSDMDEKSLGADRRFFGRGGEIIYLMLNRSEHTEELKEKIIEVFFDTKNESSDPFNKIAAYFTNSEDITDSSEAKIGYLPLKKHLSYDKLAEDWINILSLNNLPSSQKFEPLSRINAFNLIRYILDRSYEESYREKEPIILDATNGDESDIFAISKIYLSRSKQVILESIKSYIKRSLDQIENKNIQDVKNHIETQFDYQVTDTHFQNVEEIENAFIFKAQHRSRNNIVSLIEPLGREIGLITARKGVGTWFCPSNDFIEALVLARVKKPIPIFDFLNDIYIRYHLVIAPKEAIGAFNILPCDISSFEQNLHALEKRLINLGYVKRLSDDCAFVSNPYYSEN